MGSDSASRERFRQFRLLLGGSSVSMLGSRMMTIAYPMLALRLTHSPVTAGWFGCAVIAPSVLVYLPAGVLVDRCRPRRVMLASEFGRGVAIVAVIALVVGFGRRSIPYLLVPAIFEECLGVVSSLAERRYVRLLARREWLASALASSEARVHVVVTLARPAAGLLFEISYILPFIGNLASFACSVACLLYLKSREISLRTLIRQARLGSLRTLPKRAWKALAAPAVPSGGAGIVKIVADTWVAFRWICKDEFARVAIPLSASSSLIAQALIIVFLTRALPSHQAAWSQGMVLAGSGVGGAAGSMLARWLARHLQLSWVQTLMQTWSITLFLFIVNGQSTMETAIVLSVFGFTGAVGNIELDTYLSDRVDPSMLARISSMRQLCGFVAAAAGSLVGGLLLTGSSIPATVWILLALTAAIALSSHCAFRLSFHQGLEDRGTYWAPSAASESPTRTTAVTSERLKARGSDPGRLCGAQLFSGNPDTERLASCRRPGRRMEMCRERGRSFALLLSRDSADICQIRRAATGHGS